MKPTLLILAAGAGRRYGGLKQIEPVGPDGATIIDYSVFDALRAGFGKLVFVIRKEIEQTFREVIGQRFEERVEVRYAFQELDDLPAGHSLPAIRTKPWGTAHAVLAGESVIDEPFAVINADDFYGAESFEALSTFLSSAKDEQPAIYAMVGFVLQDTLSRHGTVSRGICRVDQAGYLEDIVEITAIQQTPEGIFYTDQDDRKPLRSDETVSLNTWGFTPSIFTSLRREFAQFLETADDITQAEFFIPSAVETLMAKGLARVKVLTGAGRWFGVTYKDDIDRVRGEIRGLIDAGRYPEKLWT